MIKLANLSYTYADGTVALDNVSAELSFAGSEHITAIVGQSGSGKTTLLQCIAGFLTPQQGEIEIDGEPAASLSEYDFRAKVGVVFQDLFLFPHRTVLGNLTLAMNHVLGMGERTAAAEAQAMLERVSVAHLADSYPAQLSGGQAQRVAIARALVMKPRFVLLDEPTSALDINTTNAFCELLRGLTASNFIIVTHDIPFVRSVAHRAVLLQTGRIVAHDTVEKVMASFMHEESRE